MEVNEHRGFGFKSAPVPTQRKAIAVPEMTHYSGHISKRAQVLTLAAPEALHPRVLRFTRSTTLPKPRAAASATTGFAVGINS